MSTPDVSKIELSPHEVALLTAFYNSEESILGLEDLSRLADLELSQVRSSIERLKMKDALLQASERIESFVTLSDSGQDCKAKKIPELRLWATLAERGSVAIAELQNRDDMERRDAGAAFGALKKRKAVVIDKGQVSLAEGADASALEQQQAFLVELGDGERPVAELNAEQQAYLKDKRLKSMFKVRDVKRRSYQLTDTGQALKGRAKEAANEIAQLTPAMLKNDSWRGRRFRPYNIGLPPRLVTGYRNKYRTFLDKLKRTLTALGFEEMRGSLVENEFWDMDALFMPQFHPARDIHDVYFIEEPTHAKDVAEPHLSNIAKAHEGTGVSGSRGWGYVFDKERTKRLVLRSQGTVLSSRQLTMNPNIPGKYFSVARCFRYDEVDSTHAPDFFQIEGIVLAEDISLRHLLGLLDIFAREIAGATEIKAVPAYFPFTEPSVEVHMKHPSLGWMELGGAGIFRPEVSQALGIEVPVIAWGLGVDRMAMVRLNIDDIRHLFTNNLPEGLKQNRLW